MQRPSDKTGEYVGYARVSTEDQELTLQVDALERAGCINIYTEKISGAAKKRPKLDLAIKDLRPGDTLVVWRLDRLARSVRDFHARLEQIEKQGAQFRSLTESFDTVSAGGKFMIGILASVAELERQLTIERTTAGMAAARLRGAMFGAVRKMTPARIREAKKLLRKKDWSVARVAAKFGVSDASIYKYVPQGKLGVTGQLRYVRLKPKKKRKT